MKVIVYAICKNEEKNIKLWYDSMKEADWIYLLDTGSTDNTVAMFKSLPKVTIVQEEITPWRFDVARNKSLDLVPEDVDVCVCTDIDERFAPGWRKKLEEVWTPETTRGKYMYNWELNDDGTPKICFYLNKIHARHGYWWEHPVHEVIATNISEKEVMIDIELNHYQDRTKSRSMYLEILEQAVRDNPNEERDVYCLGREYRAYNRHDDTIATLHKFLSMPRATWNQERSTAMRLMAQSYKEKGYLEEAEMWYKHAIKETPDVREPYYELGVLYVENNKNAEGLDYLNQALAINTKNPNYLNEEKAWNGSIYDYLSYAEFSAGNYQKALEYAEEALKHFPTDERIKGNLELIRNQREEKK